MTNATCVAQQPRAPGVVVGGRPAGTPEQHDAEATARAAARGASAASMSAATCAGERDRVLDRLGVGVGAVDHEREPQRQAAGPARQVVGVVGRVPLVRAVVVVDGVEVRRVLGVHALGEPRLAVEQRGAVERREQPLVRVDDERVGELDARRSARARSARTAPRRRTRRRRGTTARARARPCRCRAGRRRCPALVVPDVATTATTDSGSASASSAARSASPVNRWSAVRDHERVDVDDRQRVLDRRVRLVADRDAQPAVARLLAVALDEAAARGVAGDDERREVAGRAARDERAARRTPGSPAASAIQRSAWFSAATAPAASSHEIPCSDAADTTMSNSSAALVGAAGMKAKKRGESAERTVLRQVLGVDVHDRGAGRCPRR